MWIIFNNLKERLVSSQTSSLLLTNENLGILILLTTIKGELHFYSLISRCEIEAPNVNQKKFNRRPIINVKVEYR